MGKGSARRPTNEEAYRKNYDLIFRKTISCPDCGKDGWDYETGYCEVCHGK